MGTSVFSEAPSGELADAIQQMNAARSALHASIFEAIVAYDRRKLWKEEGASCMASWLATWIGIPNYLAQEWMRVAHGLDKLPYIAAAYKLGHLCWGHVRLLTRHATKDTQTEWVDKALGMTVDQLQDAIRSKKRPSASSAQETYRNRFLILKLSLGR